MARSGIRIKLNKPAVRQLLRSDAMVAELRRRAEAIAEAAGPGHEVDTHVGPRRARATVATATPEAMLAEARTRNLTRALDAGRR